MAASIQAETGGGLAVGMPLISELRMSTGCTIGALTVETLTPSSPRDLVRVTFRIYCHLQLEEDDPWILFLPNICIHPSTKSDIP